LGDSVLKQIDNRQWILKSRPHGSLSINNFAFQETKVDIKKLEDGNILMKNLAFLCAPTMRNWMDPPSKNLYPSIELGQPILAPTAGEIVESKNDSYPVGSKISTLSSWQDYEIIDPKLRPLNLISENLTPVESIGKFGLNSLTGYFGLTKIGIPKSGETVVVSAAAGATGSVAAQVAKLLGCRVIGIAGGTTKCSWLTEEIGLEGAIDYKSENIDSCLKELCPDGIDIYFDNVGGNILRNAVQHMAKFGRIVLCGQISTYDSEQSASGPEDMMRLIYGSVRMEGFLTRNYAEEFSQAIQQLQHWEEKKQLILKEDVRKGFESLPQNYLDLFSGSNEGILVVSV